MRLQYQRSGSKNGAYVILLLTRMKIAVDIRDAGEEKTGKGWYTFNLISELLKLDQKNEYLFYTNNENFPFKKQKNVTVKQIEGKPSQWHLKVLKDMKEEKVNVFFAPTSYIIPALAPKSIRVVITVHDLVAFLFPATHKKKAVVIERLTLSRALKKASHVFVVSENTRKDLLKQFKYPENRITETPCAPSDFYRKPVSQKDLEEFKEQMKLPDNFILTVGTIEPRKNFPTLIKSFTNFKKWHPEYKLVIVGKKGWKYHKIEESLEEYGVKDDVIFPGYLKDTELKKMYHLAKVFVFPSLYEGFGIPPLEAMACGCPVVSSNVASMPEVVGEAGLLIDPTNAYKMADAISGLIDNESVRSMLIEKGYAQSQKFEWKESAARALEVFNSFLE